MIRRLLIVSGCLFLLGQVQAQAPNADFSATPTSGCGPLGVQFTDHSSNNPTAWSWDFGNGQTSARQNPGVVYTTPGTFTVTLIARNASGANATRKVSYITVFPYPQPQFTSNLLLACAPAGIQFTDASSPGQGSITSWNWNFGDGATSNVQNPSHTYTQTGYFNVSLAVTNSGGCSNTINAIRYLRVVNGIQPNFTFDQSSIACSAPFSGQLLNQSAGPGNLTYNWTMDNGALPANSTDASPKVTFPAGGSYDVTLQVASSLGCSASIKKTLPFSNANAVINGPDTVCVNTPASYSNGSAPPPTTTLWTFGDGTGSSTATTSKSWSATGTYTVKLINQYPACADSASRIVQVVTPAVAAFTASPVAACKPSLTVNFTDQSTGNPISWQWDFGDGGTSTQHSPSHTYSTTGNFTVTLTVSNAGGCTNVITKQAFVTVQAPSVTIGGALSACTSSTATFNTVNPIANVTSVDGAATYAWSAPQSNEISSTSPNPAFTYNTAGNYTISVTVTTTGGCTATASTGVQIGTPLAPDFTLSPNPVCNDNPVTFQSTTPNATNWLWDFGDHSGHTQSGSPTAVYTYRYYGPHVVTLTVVNNGCTQQATHVETIDPPFAHFTFGLDPGQTCTNKFLIAFKDTSAIDINYGAITWDWNFDDPPSGINDSSQLENPEHQYPNTGGTPTTYNVKLIVTNGGCKDSITVPVVIGSITPSFSPPNGATACRNVPVSFTSSSTPTNLIATYSWGVDGGPFSAPSTSPTFQTTFTTNGNHNVSLNVVDNYNCIYPVTNSIQITGPTAKFTALPGGCLNAPVTFTDATTPDPPANVVTGWSWNFNDGSAGSTLQSPSHSFADTGFYTPLLTVTDNAGCTDTFSLPIQITSPTASFFGPDSFYCAGVPLPLTDSSHGYGITEAWDYGDGTTGTTPVHTFPTSGNTYNVQLTVTDRYGCPSTVTKPVRIQNPIAAFSIADTTAICWPLQTFFLAHGQYYDSLYWNFGDGTTSTLDSTSHFYNDYGADSAKLFLQGPGGCLDSAARLVQVVNPLIVTGFSYGPPLKACDSLLVLFQIKPPPYSLFSLFYGDLGGDSSQNTAPSHIYHNPGVYGPYLSLSDPTGCIVSIAGAPGAIYILGSTPFFSVNKGAFCDSGVVQFSDFSFSNDGMTGETYNFGDGSPGQTLNPGTGAFNVSHLYDQPGNFFATLKVTTNSGCTETYSDTINIYPTPHPTIATSGDLCDGYIHFQGGTTAPQTDSVTWNWNFGDAQHSNVRNPVVRMSPGTYRVILQATVAPLGCNDTTSSSVTIHPLPVITGPKEINTPVGFPVAIPFTYTPGIVTYNWVPPTNLDCPTCPDPTATLIYSQEYQVTVTDQYGCVSYDSILINTICNDKNYFLPNTFSPNGDGVNDYFFPRGSNLYNIQSMTIFNRWGQMVFQRRDFPANTPSMGWDGTINGHPAPVDAYVYIVEVICNNAQVVALHGNVTLIR